MRARVETLDGLSAHADRGEMLDWLERNGTRPRRVHLVHGEPDAAAGMAGLLRERLKLEVHVPDFREQVNL